MFPDYSLYLVTGENASSGRSTEHVVEQALAVGVDIVQMREKHLSEKELIYLGSRLAKMCRDNNAVFIVNDDPFIARETGACGVHLGQEDILKYPVEKTREILGKDKMIGLSTHSYEQVEAAWGSDVDYIAFGPVFPTETKDYFIGTDEVEKVIRFAVKPVVFIGGIDPENINGLLGSGARNIAVIRAITRAVDIKEQVRSFKKIINDHKLRQHESKN